MADDTVTYELEGQHYTVPTGTSMDELDQYVQSQKPSVTKPASPAVAPTPTAPGLTDRSKSQAPSNHGGLYDTYHKATPESRASIGTGLTGIKKVAGAGALAAGAAVAPEAYAAIPDGTLPAAGHKALQVGKTVAYMKGGQMIGKALGLPYGDLAGLIFGSSAGKSGEAATPEDAAAPEAAADDGVQVVPEPRPLFKGEQPGVMQSIPRNELPDLASSAKPGAGTQLQNIGKKIIYQPRGVIGRK